MGCCACHSLNEVEQDPGVSLYTNVGDIVFFRPWLTSQVIGLCDGVLYVKDGTLYYETKCCSRLCCRCARQGFSLSEIRSVVFAQSDSIRFQGPRRMRHYGSRQSYVIVLSPGVKITTANNTLIAVASADAAVFAEQLQQACSHLQKNDENS